MGHPRKNDGDRRHSNARSAYDNRAVANGSTAEHGFGAENLSSDGIAGTNTNNGAEPNVKGALPGAMRLGVKGVAKLWDAGEFGVKSAGSMANTLGALVADASGNRIGPEGRLSFPRFPGSKQNRSSRRAAGYVIYEDSQN
jgi:hypothetical protein